MTAAVSLVEMKKLRKKYKKVRFNGMLMDEHRAVAIKYWGEEACKGMDVHHKNGDTLDNRIENLELIPHALHISKHTKGRVYTEDQIITMKRASREYWNGHFSKQSKRIVQETLSGIPIVGYESSFATASYGFDDTAVNKCCIGRLKTYRNFKWRFVRDGENLTIPFLQRLPKRFY